ncbi:hypothetical protein [Streptomonospora sediminis]
MADELEYRALLTADIERSAGRGNVALRQIRAALMAALRAAFERSGIAWADCIRDDLGDGIRVAAPAGLAKSVLIHPLIHELAVRLRAHNRTAAPQTAVRVRVALHAGEVYVGGQGGAGGATSAVGSPLEILARMVDAPALKTALAEAPEGVSVALLLSQHFYDETVRHGYAGIDPDTFHKIAFTTKEYTADAWLHLAPDTPVPQQVSQQVPQRSPAPEPAAPEPASAGSTMINKAAGNGTVFATQHGDQHIHGIGAAPTR